MKKIRIALLDDGLASSQISIDCEHYEFCVVNNQVLNLVNNKAPIINHGAICAKIITQDNPNIIELYSYIIKEYSNNGCIDDLLKCLYHTISINADIIHLSVGSCSKKDYSRLKKVINSITRRGIIVIAAISNKNIITYPASFSNVLGVSHNIRGMSCGILYYKHSPIGVNVSVCSPRSITDIYGKAILLPFCNSFAAALVTSNVLNMISKKQNYYTLDQILNYYKKNAGIIYDC